MPALARCLGMAAVLVLSWITVAAVPAADQEEQAVMAYRALFQDLDQNGPNSRVLDRSTWPNQPVLASYLEFDILRHPDYQPTLQELRGFMERWPDHPQMERVLKLMDQVMTLTGENEETLAWYQKRPPKSSAAIIRYMNLLVGRKLFAEAAVIWQQFYREGGSSPQSLLDFAREQEIRLTQEDYEARARALLTQGKINLYKVQLLRLPKNRQAFFQALEAAREGQSRFRKLVQKLAARDQQDSELWFEWINNLRINNKFQEGMQLVRGREGKWLTPEHRQTLRFRLARGLLYTDENPKDAFLLLEDNVREMGGKLEDSLWLSAWSAYLQGKRHVALERLMQLAHEATGGERRSQGGYWAAKLLETEGQSPKAMLHIAGQYPEHFYGMLAAEALNLPSPLAKEREECLTLRQNPVIVQQVPRMMMLRAVNRTQYNIQEIQSLADRQGLTMQDQVCLAVAHAEAEHIVKMARKFQKEKGSASLDGLFPVPKGWKPLTGWQLDPALLWSVARQESLFSPAAESPAGAVGVIQLMPATARNEAKILSLPDPTARLLRTPDYNLALGQNFLMNLVKRFSGDLALAIAGYNAGPGRSIKWREFRHREEIPHFYEKIPFTETREYVKRVLHGYAAYQWVLYGKGSLTAMIQPNTPGLPAVLASRTLHNGPVNATSFAPAVNDIARSDNPLLDRMIHGRD